MPHKSIETIRMYGAKTAFDELVDPLSDEKKREFKSAAEAAPFMIRTLGLGSGVATLAAKGDERMKLAGMICKWLANDCEHSPWHGTPQQQGCWVRTVLNLIATSNRAEYRAAQSEAIGYTGWIKRLAQAFCVEEDA